MLLFGVATYLLGTVSHDIGWAAPVLWARLGGVVAIVVIAWPLRGRPGGRRPTPGDTALACFVGFADLVGVAAYARGAELGLVSVMTAASVAFILIPVVGGLLVFRERPAPSQFWGWGS